MANTTTGLFESLVMAFSEASAAPMYENALIDTIYLQYRGISAQYGQTMQVNIPVVNEGDASDIGAGPIQLTDTQSNTVNLVVNNNKSVSFLIRDFDQVRTPQDLRELYVDAKREALLRKINRTIANQINATNFATYTTVSGGTAVFTRLNIAAGWANLAGAGAPLRPRDCFFVTSQVPYSNMLGDATQNFLQQYVVGESAAVMAQQDARFMPQFQAQVKWDQQIPQPSGKYAGMFYSRYSMAMVPVKVPLGTGGQAAPYVKEAYIFLRPGLVARLQTWYDPVQQGQVVHVHCVYALQVTRPEYGSYFQTT